MRVVFDTNVFVSFALGSRALAPLQTAWLAKQFTVLISSYLLTEVDNVLARNKFAAHVSQEDREELLSDIKALAEAVVVKQPFPEFRDPKDRYLLAMLRDGEADVLVTGDILLLELKEFEEKPILNPADFLKLLEG
jgi:uncharacterized protein